MKHKQCNSCGKLLTLDNFSPDRRASGGVRGKCKPCTAESVRWARTRRRAVPEEKACSMCERVLPASYYFEDRANSTGLTSWCRDCREAHHYGRYKDRRPKSRDRHK